MSPASNTRDDHEGAYGMHGPVTLSPVEGAYSEFLAPSGGNFVAEPDVAQVSLPSYTAPRPRAVGLVRCVAHPVTAFHVALPVGRRHAWSCR
jgi:hypothetical protein